MTDSKLCRICGDTEPVHVHNGDQRIEDHFTVGRGETEMDAAQRWKSRALNAEAASVIERIYAPHPGLNHEFRTTCLRCGESGYLHISLITNRETVRIEDRPK